MSRIRKTVLPFRWNVITIAFTQGTAGSVNLASFLSNPENRTITYSVIGALPSGITLNGSTVSYNGTSPVSSASVQFRAVNGSYTADSASTAVAINAPVTGNTAPTWVTAEALASIQSGQAFSFTLTATDAQSDPITFTYAQPPFGAVTVQNQSGGTRALVWSGTAPTVTTDTGYTFPVDATDVTPLGQVTGLTATTGGPATIGLSWSAVTNATAYTVERSLTGSGDWTVLTAAATSTSYTAVGLSASTLYFFRVKATNATQVGEYSAARSAMTSAVVELPPQDFEPAIIGEEQPVQYIPSDAGEGPGWSTAMSRAVWNKHLGLFWTGTFSSTTGDFVDANGSANGSTPFATIPVPAATVGTYVSASGAGVVNLVQRALNNGNKGFYLKTIGTSSQAQVQGRLGVNPPLLSVTTNQGVFNNLPCRGFANWYNAGASVEPRNSTLIANLGTSRYGHLSFDLSSVTGTVTSATLSLYVNSQASTNPSIGIWECNPPSFFLGAGDNTPSMVDPVTGNASLAVLYPGDTNLHTDPDVLYAGDFAGTTLDYSAGIAVSPRIGRIRFPDNDPPAYPSLVTSSEDATVPAGTTAWKGTFAPVFTDGGSRRGATTIRGHKMLPVFESPYPIDPSTLEEDLYFRMYVKLDDNFLYEDEGNKMAITWDCRFGYWNIDSDPTYPNGGYWFATTGNGGDPGDGLASLSTTIVPNQNRILYEGNMFRMESGSVPPANSPYRDMRPWIGYNYQTPPNQSPGTNAGVTHYTNIANGKFRRGRWYCIEQRLKLNTVNGPYDEYGNGTGVADGLVETWSNGVKIDSQSGWQIRNNKYIGIAGAGTEWYMGGKGDMPLTMNFYINHMVCARRYIGPRVRP